MVKYYTAGSSALAPDDQEGDISRSSSDRSRFQVVNGGKSSRSSSDNSSRNNLRVIDGGQSDQDTNASSQPSHSNFRVINGGKAADHNSKDDLRDSENNALTGSQPSFYRGTGRSKDDKQKKKGGWLLARKKGMIGVILSLSLMVGGGTFLGGSNSLLAPAFNEVVTEITDLQHSSNTARTLRLTRYMLNSESITTTTWTGAKKYTSMTGYFKKNLARNDIEVGGSDTSRILKFKDETITAADFERVYRDNIEFRDAYTSAKRGRILGFFDNIANRLYTKLGLSRNAFKDYKQTNDSEADTQKFRETMTEESDINSKANTKTSGVDEETVEVEDPDTGETRTEIEKVRGEGGSSGASGDSAEAKAKGFIEASVSKVEKVSGIASQVTGWGCTFMKLANMISIAVAANEIYQSINYFMGLAENPSKMKMGYGSESGINSMLNFVTTDAKDVEYDDYNKVSFSGNVLDADDNSNISSSVGTSKISGSPMEANGMQKIMTGLPVNTNMANNFSLERSIKVLGGAATTTAAAFHTCAIAQTGAAIVSIAVSIGTLGLSSLASYAMSAVIGIGLNVVMGAALNFLIPAVAKALFTNIFENATGIPAGELLARGAFAANTRVGRTGSAQTPSSEEAITAYNKLNNEVIAMDAEVDRYNRSPFDITSKNTFLGSIAYQFGTTSSTKLTGKIKNLMRTTSSAIASVTGSAFADGEKTYIMTFGECPLLESLGVKGDMYCNPITTTDLFTIDIPPDDVNYINAIKSEMDCDSDGNCEIHKNGNLAKFITYCDDRDSPYGATDGSILEEMKKGGTVTMILGSLPIVGDLVDIFDAAQDETNMSWANGQRCVNSPQNSGWADGTSWDNTYKYYQRYIQDQRLLEQMGVYGSNSEDGSKNPVGQFLEEYDREHPLDNTPSGYLARISGLSKEDSELILDVAWYYNFLENYDATTRIAMDGTASDTLDGEEVVAKLDYEFRYKNFEKNFESDNHASRAIVAEHIIYADVRNRSYAV